MSVPRTFAAAVSCSALPAVAVAPPRLRLGRRSSRPATTVWEAGGSNMGECSAYLGTLRVRDDVNRMIRLHGDALGIENPGQIFHVRARQDASKPPAQECLQRNTAQ